MRFIRTSAGITLYIVQLLQYSFFFFFFSVHGEFTLYIRLFIRLANVFEKYTAVFFFLVCALLLRLYYYCCRQCSVRVLSNSNLSMLENINLEDVKKKYYRAIFFIVAQYTTTLL